MSKLIKHPGIGESPFGVPAERALVAASPPAEEIFSFRRYLDILWRRKWLIFWTAVVVCALVALNLTTVTPLYRSLATIQIDPEMRLSPYPDPSTPRQGISEEYLNTQLTKLGSPALAGAVIEKLELTKNPDFAQPIRSGFFMEAKDQAIARVKRLLKGQIGSRPDPVPTEMSTRAAQRRVRQYLSPQLVRGTNLIRLSFDSPDREVAAQVANELAEVFVEEQLKNKYQALSQASAYLENQLAEIKEEISRSIETMSQDGRAREFLVTGQTPGREELQRLNDSLSEAAAEVDRLESILGTVRLAGFDSLPATFKSTAYNGVTSRYDALTQKLNVLQGKFGPEWPEVKAVRLELGVVERQLEAEQELAMERIRRELGAARGRAAQIESELAARQLQAAQEYQDTLDLTLMTGETELNKRIYEDILTRFKQAWVTEGLSNTNIRIVDRAVPAVSWYTPNKTQSLQIALLFGLSLGVLLAFARELTDITLKSSEDVARILELPSLGSIPPLNPKPSSRLWGLLAGRRVRPSAEPMLIEMPAGKPGFAAVEAFRSLRTAILLSHPEKPPQTILVTSALPGEGKSTTAVNAASSLAQAGKRTLLLELDLRKPALAQVLGVESGRGVSGYLSGNCNLNSQIVETYLPNLFFIGCGTVPPNPPELLGSQKMTAGLTLLQDYFEHIVIDSPPLLGISDALLLARQMDGVVLVARARKTPRQAVRRSAQVIDRIGAKLLGVVTNDLEAADVGYGGRYAYDYYGGYAKDHSHSPTESASQ